MTMINLVVMLYDRDKTASFFFQGAGSVDGRSKRVEGFYKTQRYLVYRYIVELKFGNESFQHYANDVVSGYLIVNRLCGEHVEDRKAKILTMLQATYHEFSVI